MRLKNANGQEALSRFGLIKRCYKLKGLPKFWEAFFLHFDFAQYLLFTNSY